MLGGKETLASLFSKDSEDKQIRKQLKIGVINDLLETKLEYSGDLCEGLPLLNSTPALCPPLASL
jgi:hypothetical protein